MSMISKGLVRVTAPPKTPAGKEHNFGHIVGTDTTGRPGTKDECCIFVNSRERYNSILEEKEVIRFFSDLDKNDDNGLTASVKKDEDCLLYTSPSPRDRG